MKPFEESLTAWFDGVLAGDELVAFERELAAHPDAGELRREKRGVVHLRALLREHLPAAVPALGTNADFFNHQLRERIAAESRRDDSSVAARGKSSSWLRALWGWSAAGKGFAPGRLMAAGAACLLVAAAGTYALIPPRTPAGSGSVATVNSQSGSPTVSAVGSTAAVTPKTGFDAVAAADSPASIAAPGVNQRASAGGNERTEVVILEHARRDTQLSEIVTARVPEGTATTVTPVHFDDQNTDVIWLDGLDALPAAEVEGNASPAGSSPGQS